MKMLYGGSKGYFGLEGDGASRDNGMVSVPIFPEAGFPTSTFSIHRPV
jgi:hypothetical protein